jgi:eukaryotic-like serine/threonine-protein kinase
MSIATGTKLGSYEILAPLGAGGMGEVYRAHDANLGRDVAIKVLPEAFARDPERMARFQREAKVLASLNHPKIAAIYGVEMSGEPRALIMEFAEGPTLADRIAAGTIPIDEALRIARQIADALEYAHERGVVHRDLKPANIKISRDDAVKILDFGLAKAIQGEASEADIANSPTLTHMATMQGVLLGTAAYMPPEQAKAKPVDRRADIWAFGCVLYEMLVGKMAFSGETVTDTLAAVVMKDPDWTLLPEKTPARVRVLLQRCLQKDPKQRLRDIGDARISLDEVVSGAPEPIAPAAGTPAVWPLRRRALPWVIAAAAVVAAAIVLMVAHLQPQSSPEPPIVSQVGPPPNTYFGFEPPVLSPDGRQMVFAAVGADGREQLWLRPLGSDSAQPIAGTDGASLPFWSPDGRSIAFFANGKLDRLDLSDDALVSLADSESGEGGSWAPDGTIVFAPGAGGGLARIPAVGGSVQPIANLPASVKAYSERYPQFLPDGKHFLFFVWSAVPANQGVYAGSLDGGQVNLVLTNYSDALYVRPNHLLFMRQNTLMAVQFDPASLRSSGDAVPVVARLPASKFFFHGPFTASRDGVLIYGAGVYKPDSLLWFGRNGKQVGETNPAGYYFSSDTPSISPDGSKLAASIADAQSPGAIWVFDLRDGVTRPLTFSSAFSRDA